MKEDGGFWWSELTWTYAAFEKGILPEPGSLGDQPMLYLFLMSTMSAALAAERELRYEESNKTKDKNKGKKSITEEYLGATSPDQIPTPATTLSPDSLASVPGLIQPRRTLRRGK